MRESATIHSRPTLIVRSSRVSFDDRKTVVCIGRSGDTCRGCRSTLADDAQFCGMCGERIRTSDLAKGTKIDGLYEIEALIARGKTAAIYRARCVPSGRAVALKVLHPELAYDPVRQERFRREAKCLARLRDPHTVASYDHGETTDGTLYIALELLDSEGVDVRVRTRGAMPWRSALEILRAACSSLAEAHALGIVHRNLEARNVRICKDGTVKVIDFGVARLRPEDSDEELTRGGQAVGTLDYRAPELLAGGVCDGRADLYALGIIGNELIHGRRRHGMGLPSGVPPEVEALLRRCTAADRAERFASAQELADAIDELLAVPARASSPRTRVLAHTPAFELQPPRIVVDLAADEPEPRARGSRWKAWAFGLVACGLGLGTAMAGCV